MSYQAECITLSRFSLLVTDHNLISEQRKDCKDDPLLCQFLRVFGARVAKPCTSLCGLLVAAVRLSDSEWKVDNRSGRTVTFPN